MFGALAGVGAKTATTSSPSANSTAGSAWGKWGTAAFAIGGAMLAGAAAGSAYHQQDNLSVGITWMSDHMKYVGNLWEDATLKKRFEALMNVEQEGVVFRT